MHGESRRGWCVEERNSNCVLTKKKLLEANSFTRLSVAKVSEECTRE